MNALDVKNLNKNYETKTGGAKKGLLDFSMEVEKGSIFGLLGPNGAGKSTLINIISGTVRKTSGSVKIMGIDIDDNPKLAKYKIGVVPQEITIDTFFPLEDALEFYAGYYGIRPKQRKTKLILEALGLQDKAKALPRQLSGGMKRRFLVAKAMVHSPDVLILDEPTAGVDIELRDQLWDYVVRLNKENGTTIILTTHYLEEAEKLCDKIAFIDSGQLIKCDTKENLISSLSNKELLIKFDLEIREVPTILQKYEAQIIDNQKLVIKFNKNQINLNKIIEDISKANLNISDISVTEGSLEDIFRKLYSNK